MSDEPIKHDQVIEPKVFDPASQSADILLEKMNALIAAFKQLILITGKKVPLTDPKTLSEAEQLAAALKKITELEGGLTAAQQAQIQAQQILNKQKADYRNELKAQVSAYKALENQFAAAAQKAKDLAAAQGINSKAAKEAAQVANELNNKLKAIDASFGVHNREVGGYSEGMKKAFEGTGLFGEGIEKVSALLEKGHAVVEFFSASIEKMNEFFKGSKEATEAATVAEEVNTAAKESNVAATEAEVVVGEEQKIVEEATTVATEVNTVATEANTAAEKENALAKLGWIGVAVAAVIVAGKAILQTVTATQAEKDLMDARTEAAEAAAKQTLNFKANKIEIYNFIMEEFLAEKALEDARIKAIVPLQNLRTEAALAREEAMKDSKTTVERIKLLTEFIEKTSEAGNLELELAKENTKIKKEALEFELHNPTGTEREKRKALEEASAQELAIVEQTANAKRKTEKQLTTLIEKDLSDRKKMLQDAQREEIETINTTASTKTETIRKQLAKDIALSKLETEQRVADLKFQQERLGAVDAAGVDHTKDFERELEDLKKVGLKRRKDLELKAQEEIWKISTDAQTEAFKVQEAAEKEHIKYELEAIRGKFGAAEQLISEQELNTKVLLGTETQEELDAWVAMQKEKFKVQQDIIQAFVDYELKAIKGLYGEVEQKIAEQELATKVALGLPLTDAELEYLASQKKKLAEQKKKEAIETVKILEEVTAGIKEGLQKRTEIQQLADQKDIDMRERMLEIQMKLAAEGKQNVLGETLAAQAQAEEKKLQDAKKAAKQQETLALIQTFEKVLETALKNDKPFLQAFAEAIASEGLVSAAFSKLFAGFYEGTEDTGTTANPIDDKGGRVAILHDNERVVPKRLNDLLGGMSNDELVQAALAPPRLVESSVSVSEFNNRQVIEMTKEIKALREDMASKPIPSFSLGNKMGEYDERWNSKLRTTVIHHKNSQTRPSLRLNG